jgi:hypothetical protein
LYEADELAAPVQTSTKVEEAAGGDGTLTTHNNS